MGRVIGVVPHRAALTRTVGAITVLIAVFTLHGLSAVAFECHERPDGDHHGDDSSHDEAASPSDAGHASGHHGDNLAHCSSAPCAVAVVTEADLGVAHDPEPTAVWGVAPWALTNAPSAPEPPIPKSLLLT